MLSRRCQERNRTVIPRLLSQHAILLSDDQDTVNMSTAGNWLMREELVESFRESAVIERIPKAVSA